MPHRQFTDAHGTPWTVWDVHPARVERELEIVRASRSGGAASPSRSTLRLDGAYASGWLCFESSAGKRRLAPIPTRWAELDADELTRLCDEAAPVAAPRRSAFAAEPVASETVVPT